MEEIPNAAMALGRISSGLYIVTTQFGEVREGYLASWVQQTSFEPMMVSIAMKPGRSCYDQIKSHGRFCINVVGNNNKGMMKPFWTPKAGIDPFEGLESVVSARGNLILKNALAALECEFRSSVFPGDHELIFAEVVDGQVIQPEDKPLSHSRKSGLKY